MSSDDEDDAIGYKRPPKKYQFKKGRSGNPQGRPKKNTAETQHESPAAILKRIGEQTIELAGESRSLLELEFLALQTKAAKGDVAASRQLSCLRKEMGLLTPAPQGRCGVLVVPAPVPLDEWEAAAYRQQAKHRNPASDLEADDESDTQ